MKDCKGVRTPIDVIVCVHNSPDDISNCLNSVLGSLSQGDRLILVDDGSDEDTKTICQKIASGSPEQVCLIRRSEGSGFCRAANAGLRQSSAETVVVLNSDTVVPDLWLERIDECMRENSRIGIVGPLSNAGGWQSIPEYATGGPANNLLQISSETLAEIQSYCSDFRPKYDYPIVEIVNGFCIAISRKVLKAIGFFDEEHFPMGYGEETDFNFRALDAGFLCAIAVDCFVYHAKTKSYSSAARAKYISLGRENLGILYGEDRVRNAVNSTQKHPILNAIRSDARQVFNKRGWLI